jgi:hypothetical protein
LLRNFEHQVRKDRKEQHQACLQLLFQNSKKLKIKNEETQQHKETHVDTNTKKNNEKNTRTHFILQFSVCVCWRNRLHYNKNMIKLRSQTTWIKGGISYVSNALVRLTYIFIYLFLCLFIYLFIYLFTIIYLLTYCLINYLFIYLFIYLFVVRCLPSLKTTTTMSFPICLFFSTLCLSSGWKGNIVETWNLGKKCQNKKNNMK